jgi:hypothetical protein
MDIKYTLSPDKRTYAGDIEAEQAFILREGSLWYPLSSRGKPRKLAAEDMVYFTLKGKLVGRAVIDKIEGPEPIALKTEKGRDIDKHRWGMRISKIDKPNKLIDAVGVQGFKYLDKDPEEKMRFENVF